MILAVKKMLTRFIRVLTTRRENAMLIIALLQSVECKNIMHIKIFLSDHLVKNN